MTCELCLSERDLHENQNIASEPTNKSPKTQTAEKFPQVNEEHLTWESVLSFKN